MNKGKAVMTNDNNSWINIGKADEIPKLGARVVTSKQGDIAIFRTADDQYFALRDSCPHKQGPLSQGIVSGTEVACPLHDWKINLATGLAVAPDEGCAASFPVKNENGELFLSLQNS